MKGSFYRTVLLMAFLLAAGSGAAYADVSNGLMITNIAFDSQYANEKSELSLQVIQVWVKEGDVGALDEFAPVTNAVVKVTLTKGGRQIEIDPSHVKDGNYKGTVIFPEPGKWDVRVNANLRDSLNHREEVMRTTLDVDGPRSEEEQAGKLDKASPSADNLSGKPAAPPAFVVIVGLLSAALVIGFGALWTRRKKREG